MKTLNTSSEPARAGMSDNIRVAAKNDNTWINKTSITGDKPLPRCLNSIVYDSTNDRTILFGGYSADTFDDTWVYNYTDNSWTNVTTAGDKPSKRDECAMVYDSKHNRVILFGGWDGPDYDDTWIYNYTDNSWTNVTSIAGDKPSGRYGHSMVYDSAHNRTILFGGSDGAKRFDDTWVYNYTDNSWTNVTTIMGDKPSKRYGHSMVYDSAHDRTILFGGSDGASYYDDIWVYNYTDNSWTNVTTIMGDKPSARHFFSMAYDSAHDRTILFGGSTDGASYYYDTWVYSYTDNSWTNMTTITGDKPIPRYCHSMAYDSTNDRTILFGGYGGGKYRDDTWVYCFAGTPPSPLLPAADDDDDDDEDSGVVVVVVVIIIIACVGGVVVVIIVLIKKGIIGTNRG